MSDALPAPLVPPELDLRDFGFMPLEVQRLRDSEVASVADAEVFRANVLSWCAAWHQLPGATLPQEDAALARLLGYGRDLRAWRRVRQNGGLRHWFPARDGRLHHPIAAEKALEAWVDKLLQRKSSGAGNAKRWGGEFDPEWIDAALARAAGLLRDLNPRSKTLHRKLPKIPTGNSGGSPGDIPTGIPDSIPDSSPGGIPEVCETDSQGTGKGQGSKSITPSGDALSRVTTTSEPAKSAASPAVRTGQIALQIRALDKSRNKRSAITSTHPQVLEWAKLGVSDAHIREAYDLAAQARENDGDPGPINAGYLDSFIRKVLNPPAAKANGAWWDSEAATIEEAKRRGLEPRPGESWAALRERIRATPLPDKAAA